MHNNCDHLCTFKYLFNSIIYNVILLKKNIHEFQLQFLYTINYIQKLLIILTYFYDLLF